MRLFRRAGVGPGEARVLAAHAEIRSVLEDLVREGQRTSMRARTICVQLFELLLLKIEDAPSAAVQGDPAQENFQRCKALIDAEAERLMTLREIAAAEDEPSGGVFGGGARTRERGCAKRGFCGRVSFSRCFKTAHGVAPSEWLKHNRQT